MACGQACDVLRDFAINFEVTVVSAHRTPQRMFEYARSAHHRNLKVQLLSQTGAPAARSLTAHAAERRPSIPQHASLGLHPADKARFLPRLHPVRRILDPDRPPGYHCWRWRSGALAWHGGIADAAAGDRRPCEVACDERAGLSALHRADAQRRPRRHRRHRQCQWKANVLAESFYSSFPLSPCSLSRARTPSSYFLQLLGPPYLLHSYRFALACHAQPQPTDTLAPSFARPQATNAALLAIRMLGIADRSVLERMIEYQEDMRTQVLDKAAKVCVVWQAHLCVLYSVDTSWETHWHE